MDARCRICLGDQADRDIFSSTVSGDDGSELSCRQTMVDLFAFSVSSDDGLPSMLCRKCYAGLTSAYSLRRLAEKSYLRLLDERVKSEGHPDRDHRDDNERTVGASVKLERLDSDYDDDDDLPLIYSKMVKVELSGDAERETLHELKISHAKRKINRSVLKLSNKAKSNRNKILIEEQKGKRRIACKFCPKIFAAYGARKRHTLIHHFGQMYYCDICKKHCTSEYSHVRELHSDVPKPFGCTFCDKKFISEGRLRYHLIVHTKEKPFACELCDKRFNYKSSALAHRRCVHEGQKDVICHFCSKAFYSKGDLLKHIRTHTKEKNYSCTECGKKFSLLFSLTTHMKRHTGVKTEKCDVCEKMFFNKSALRVHHLSHTKEKNFECKYCGVKFGRSDHRNRHQKTAHENFGIALTDD